MDAAAVVTVPVAQGVPRDGGSPTRPASAIAATKARQRRTAPPSHLLTTLIDADGRALDGQYREKPALSASHTGLVAYGTASSAKYHQKYPPTYPGTWS